MVATSYPRFPGDGVGSFMEPIAHGVAARGHDVHVIAPWHPRWTRERVEGRVHFHLFRYAPLPSLNVFGYAEGMRADVHLRASAVAAAPFALLAGWRCARRIIRDARATIVHAHWGIPGGVIGAAATGSVPLIVSLHGSDVFVAERHVLAGRAARAVFRRASAVTACSADLQFRAGSLGAPVDRTTVVPYGVDSERFKPDAEARARGRSMLGVTDNIPLVFAFGRLVTKKGFEYLIEATAALKAAWPELRVVIAGDGDLASSLHAQAEKLFVTDRLQFLGVVPQHVVPVLLAAADVVVAPSVHDEAGNVDGLPNTVMETMASATPLVTTSAGGIGAVATDGDTALLVPERDGRALADAIERLLREPLLRAAIGRRARDLVCRNYSWARVAETFEAIYAQST